MTAPDELARFVRDALARGVSRDEIRSALVDAGWSARQVADALGAWADVPFPVPVPRPTSHSDAREAFLYLVAAVALGLAAFNLGALAFEVIEHLFPYGDEGSLAAATRWPVSILVVSVPVFLYTASLIRRDIREDPGRLGSRVRTQVTYLILFICAAIMIGVLAGVVYSFLGGEFTVRFVLKSLTAAGIAAGIFGWYLKDARREPAGEGGAR